jgi:hypothetical protein
MNHISCSRKCISVWGSEPSHFQVNFHFGSWSPKWGPKFSQSDCKGQNSLDWSVIYIIGKLLERKFLKWVCITHLEIWNTNYRHKKGRESNWQFDSQPLKIKNRPDSLMCRWRVTYCWKALNKGQNFSFEFIPIGGLHAKLWAPKLWESNYGNFGTPKSTWDSKDKMPFGC